MHRPLPVPPTAPEELSASTVTEDTVTLTWEKVTSDGGAPVEAYIIEAKKIGEKEFHKVAKVVGTELSYAATGLDDDQEYEFAIKAVNPAGASQTATELQEPIKTKLKIGMLHHNLWFCLT